MKRRGLMMLVLLGGIAPRPSAVAAAPTAAPAEIAYLIGAVESSHCDFERNGSWYDADKAADHLRKKLLGQRQGLAVGQIPRPQQQPREPRLDRMRGIASGRLLRLHEQSLTVPDESRAQNRALRKALIVIAHRTSYIEVSPERQTHRGLFPIPVLFKR